MKYYLVARTTCCMVGIEQCRGFIVGRSLRAAFENEYAGRILMVTSGAQALPGIAYVTYKRASRPLYNINAMKKKQIQSIPESNRSNRSGLPRLLRGLRYLHNRHPLVLRQIEILIFTAGIHPHKQDPRSIR